MNGTEPKIEIFKPFGEAFELMKKILFQPFDLTKWLVIGFSAFLASFSGGFHSSFNPFSSWSGREDRKAIAESLRGVGSVGQLDWWVIALIVIGALILLAVIVVVMWLGARGRFIFTDCIVRNRGAIIAPWKEFRAQGNSFFLFSLLIALCIIGLVAIAALKLVLPMIAEGVGARPGLGFWIGLSLLIFFIFCFSISWALISQLIVPIMYRQRCSARRALAQILGLITAHPGPIILYLLFLLLLVVAAAMIGCAAACVTCCIAAIPYIGTVILLPIPVTLSGFLLLFLRQFGSDYDVWADFIPSELSPILLSASAPQASMSSLNLPPDPPASPA